MRWTKYRFPLVLSKYVVLDKRSSDAASRHAACNRKMLKRENQALSLHACLFSHQHKRQRHWKRERSCMSSSAPRRTRSRYVRRDKTQWRGMEEEEEEVNGGRVRGGSLYPPLHSPHSLPRCSIVAEIRQPRTTLHSALEDWGESMCAWQRRHELFRSVPCFASVLFTLSMHAVQLLLIRTVPKLHEVKQSLRLCMQKIYCMFAFVSLAFMWFCL